MGAIFIAGAGTDIGKTYVTAALTRGIRARGGAVRVLKPLASGVAPLADAAFADSDTARLLTAAGLPLTEANVDACSPWRFALPLAPDRAAAAEGRRLELGELLAWCRSRMAEAAPDETVLIEGVGGLMSPITNQATGLDWLLGLGCPAILVAGSYLGAISHALTALAVIAARGIPLQGVVVSESEPSAGLDETIDALNRFAAVAPIVGLGRGETRLSSLTEP
jgi:dethiobiotin synthetase